jgi:hypothetical protein
MSRRNIAFSFLALVGAALALSEPTFAAGGGIRGMPGGGFRAPMFMPRSPRGIMPASPRAIARSAFTPRTGHGLGHAFRPHGFGPSRHAIPPSPHGYATTTPQRPFSRLVRRHHGIYHQGWYFPTTIGDDFGYIGTPYDPSEAIPVYGPAPSYDDPADPPPPRRAPASARVTNPDDENRDACRAETVTVPARDGERAIKVVRC